MSLTRGMELLKQVIRIRIVTLHGTESSHQDKKWVGLHFASMSTRSVWLILNTPLQYFNKVFHVPKL